MNRTRFRAALRDSLIEMGCRLQQLHPQRFAEAMAMEANADIEKPEVVGLRRRGRVSERSLIAWSRDQIWPQDKFADQSAAIACECGL